MIIFLIMNRYKRSDGSNNSSQASAQSGTGKSSQKNSGIGFDSRSFKGKSKVLIFLLVSLNAATKVYLTNRMWFSVVCTLIDNDTRHHSGQNVVDSR